MVMPLEVPLLHRIVLAILGFLFFHMKFIIVLSRSVKNCIGILMGIALNLYIAFGRIAIFIILIPPYPKAWEIFTVSGIFFNFLLQRIKVLVE